MSFNCTSSYGMCVLGFIGLNVTVEGEEGDLRPVQPDLLGSGGLRDIRTTALLILEHCPSVCIDRQLIFKVEDTEWS